MKKVLFVSHLANFQKFNRPYMRWFKEKGWQVDYLSSNEEQILDVDNIHEVKIARSPLALVNVFAIFKIRKIIKQNSYDIIHCHTPMGGVVARLAAKRFRKNGLKVIYTAHGFHFFKGAPKINWLIFYNMEKYLSKFTDAIVTINQEDYQIAKDEFHCQIHKIDGVGVGLDRFNKASEVEKLKLRKKYGYNKEDFVVIYVAEFIKRKNHIFLLKSLLKNNSIKIILAGKGKTMSEMERYVNDNNLSKNVEFMGYRKDVNLLFQIADIGISVSYQEGLPINVIEAMASGLPVIATNIRGQRDVIKNNKNGILVEQNDISQLQNAIEKLKNNELRQKISKNNLNDVQKYSLKNAINNMAKVYNKVINEK